MFNKGKNNLGFTLVELIVVITILAILGTIAFLSFQGYSKSARDSVRVTDMGNIKTSLDIFFVKTGKFPNTTQGEEITFSGTTAWTQGTFGSDTFTMVDRMNKLPIDPLTGLEYVYSVTNTKQEYQLAQVFESGVLSLEMNSFDKLHAGDKLASLKIAGNYNGRILKVNQSNITYILAVPSIITSTGGVLQDIINNGSLAYSGFKNLPLQYRGSTYNELGDIGAEFVKTSYLVVYSGSLDELVNDTSKRLILVTNLQKAYSGTLLTNVSEINELININLGSNNEVELLGGSLLNNSIGTKIDISNQILVQKHDTINNLGTASYDTLSDVIFDGSNYLAVGKYGGYSAIVKYDSNLNLIDFYNFGGFNAGEIKSVIYDGTNYVAVGYTSSDLTAFGGSNSFWVDFFIATFDENLNLINVKNFGGLDREIFNSVIYDGTNYIAVGYSDGNLSGIGAGTNTLGSKDFVIAKFDTDLTLLSLNNNGGTNDDRLYSLIYDGTNYVAVGFSQSNLSGVGGGTNKGLYDLLIAKYDANLDMIAVNNLGGSSYDGLYSVIYDGTNYVAVGNSQSDLSLIPGGSNKLGDSDYVIAKFDSSLNLTHFKNFGGTLSESFSSLIYDGSNYIAVGSSQSDLSGITGGDNTQGASDFAIAKFDTNLNLSFFKNFGGTLSDSFSSLIYDGSNYITVGSSLSDLSGISGGSDNQGSYDYVIGNIILE